jgi:hypothetical protein
MASRGVGVREGDSGSGAGSLFFGIGSEAQEAEGQGKKTMVWGKKEKFTPAALFISLQVRVVGVVVLHYPDRFYGKSPRGSTEWGGAYCNCATRQ